MKTYQGVQKKSWLTRQSNVLWLGWFVMVVSVGGCARIELGVVKGDWRSGGSTPSMNASDEEVVLVAGEACEDAASCDVADVVFEMGPKVVLPDYDVNGYYTYEAIEGFMKDVAADHPQLTELVSIGETTEGREILALRITHEGDGEEALIEKPRVLITAGVHAREQQPYHFALSLIAELINGYASSDYVKRLVQTREVWVVGCVNPDGKVFDLASGEEGGWKYWRKNRRNNGVGVSEVSGGSGGPGNLGGEGVDLNRNSAVRWGGADTEVESITYQGPEPFSEPETRALRGFVDEVGFVSWLELHSAGGEVFIPRYLTLSEWKNYKGLYDAFHRSQVSSYGPLTNGRQLQPAGTQPGIYRAGNTGTLWQWGYYTRGIYTAIMEIRADPTRDASLLHYPSREFTEAEYRNNGRDAMLSWIDEAGGLTAVTEVSPEEGPGFKIEALLVDDDTRRDSNGNANTVAEPNETIELELDLRNSGHAIAEDVWVTLTSLDPAVRVLVEYRSDFGSLLPGQNSAQRLDMAPPRFVVEIKNDAKLGHQAELVFNVFDKQRRRWTLPYYLSIGTDTSLSQ